MPPDNRALKTGTLRFLRELAIHDWIVVVYLTVLTAAVALSPQSSIRSTCLRHVAVMFGLCLTVLVLVRGRLLRDHFFAPLLYRLGVYGAVQISYFEFRELLPLVNPSSLDAQLSFIDERVLHFEPSLYLDRFVTPATTEWFAFFYFGYFALLASHVLPLLFFSRRLNLVGEFGLGMILLYAASHIVYMLVPGYGPVRFLAERFQHELPLGTWMNMVLNAVQSGGAQKDIFPSLHTGGPVVLCLFSFRHRDKLPFKYTWPFVWFFSANIVMATMFLRWHYLVDVLAGIVVAVGAFTVASRFSPREIRFREAQGLSPVWMPFRLRPFTNPLPAGPRPGV